MGSRRSSVWRIRRRRTGLLPERGHRRAGSDHRPASVYQSTGSHCVRSDHDRHLGCASYGRRVCVRCGVRDAGWRSWLERDCRRRVGLQRVGAVFRDCSQLGLVPHERVLVQRGSSVSGCNRFCDTAVRSDPASSVRLVGSDSSDAYSHDGSRLRRGRGDRDGGWADGDAQLRRHDATHVHTTLPSVAGTGIVHVINGVVQSPASPVDLTAGATEISGVLPVGNGALALRRLRLTVSY